jgi:hypothetical protein
MKQLRQAHEALDLNRPEAPEWDGQLLYWLQTVSAEADEPFFEESSELLKRTERMIQRFEGLVAALPKDAGRRRPYNDQRFLSDMADIFGSASVRIYIQLGDGSSSRRHSAGLHPTGRDLAPARKPAPAVLLSIAST